MVFFCSDRIKVGGIETANRRFSKREEFNLLFKQLTGIDVENAEVGEDGWIFVPPEVDLGSKDREKRSRISELADHNWKNHLVNDQYAGWWIKPPEGTSK